MGFSLLRGGSLSLRKHQLSQFGVGRDYSCKELTKQAENANHQHERPHLRGKHGRLRDAQGFRLWHAAARVWARPPAFPLIKTRNRLLHPPSCNQQPTRSVDDPAVTAHCEPAESIIEQQGRQLEHKHICVRSRTHAFDKAGTLNMRTLDETPPSLPHPCGYTRTPAKWPAERADTPAESIRVEAPSPLQLINSH